MARQIAPWQRVVFGRGQLRTFRPVFRFGQRYHLDSHGQLALKQFRLSVLNEVHTNSYTGPRLIAIFVFWLIDKNSSGSCNIYRRTRGGGGGNSPVGQRY